MATPLSALTNLISINVAALEATYADKGVTFPSLDDPFVPTSLDFDPSLAPTKALIVAAAAQILATVRSPIEMLQEYSPGMYFTATLGFVVDTNIPDLLSKGGPEPKSKGLPNAHLTARILRFLATRHIFREVKPDVFANNRISSLLSKNKSISEIIAERASPRYRTYLPQVKSTSNKAPIRADEALTSSVHFSEFVQNPTKATSAFNIGLKTEAKLWEWYEEPGNEWRARRFTATMKGGADRFPGEMFVQGIGLKNLKDGDFVVDVGGSVGSCTLHLYKAFPKINYVVQDLEKQIVAAASFWQENAPEAVLSGKVILRAHDFFTPQPVKGAAVYFLRMVIHDWSDHDAKNILKHLRDAANESSKLVIIDTLAFHVCEDTATEIAALKAPAPYPLLANLGIGRSGLQTLLDIQMMNLFNGKERTEEEFRTLGLSAGWKLETIVHGPLSTFTFSMV
ncbi:hypothetical protein C0995_007556 [Termitomyces sp. Mi166|nr:hypothetical protein C0995_007556 [Termitomyces sp. Mi166\